MEKTFLNDLNWFASLMACTDSTGQLLRPVDLSTIPEPDRASEEVYAQLTIRLGLSPVQRFALLLALAPHVAPKYLEVFQIKTLPFSCGGIITDKRQFLPTGETLCFLLAADDPESRLQLESMFDPEQVFEREMLLGLQPVKPGEPRMSGVLQASRLLLDLVRYGEERLPVFSTEFPAKLLHTKHEWNELIVSEHTLTELNYLLDWIKFSDQLLSSNMHGRNAKPGYRALFWGPSGTGKTLAASLLGKITNRPVFRIDLSMVVSKYIGETEKNLGRIFDRAEHRNWILFFDEADALFGKRTGVQDAHDRYANQEVSFLLQRIEDYNGLVILASNFKQNLDDAFTRRFQSIVHFPLPKPNERLKLWQLNLPKNLGYEGETSIEEVAKQFELSGAAINNISYFASLLTLRKGDRNIHWNDLREGIRRELDKEGRIM